MPPLVYFVRHGNTDWNAEGRLQGQADTGMNALGRAQADRNGRTLARLIKDPAAFDFVASPLGRTRETMRRIRIAMGLEPDDFATDARLLEVHFGDWQNQTFAEIEARTPGAIKPRRRDKWNFLPPGAAAESYDMLFRRVRPWFLGLSRPTVCVTHGGVLRVLFRLVEDTPPDEAAALEIMQDRVLRYRDERLEWL